VSIIAFACTKEGVSVVHSSEKKSGFRIFFHERVAVTPGNWIALMKSLESILSSCHKSNAVSQCIVVKVASGKFNASPDTYKTEGFVEFVITSAGHTCTYVTKQSLAKALNCAKKEKWQAKSETLFNSGKTMKGFHSGYDAACSGAYGLAK